MKRIIAAILVLAMALSLCGCKKSTNMKLLAHYGGYGIAGQDLGSGSYEIEIKNLKEGGGPIPNHQSPIPNPQSPIPNPLFI